MADVKQGIKELVAVTKGIVFNFYKLTFFAKFLYLNCKLFIRSAFRT